MAEQNGKPSTKGLLNWLPVFIVAIGVAVGYASWKGATAAELGHIEKEVQRLDSVKVEKSEYAECIKRIEQNVEKIDKKQQLIIDDVGGIRIQQTRIEGKVDQLLNGDR